MTYFFTGADSWWGHQKMVKSSPSPIVGCRPTIGQDAHQIVEFCVLENFHLQASFEGRSVGEEKRLFGLIKLFSEIFYWNRMDVDLY